MEEIQQEQSILKMINHQLFDFYHYLSNSWLIPIHYLMIIIILLALLLIILFFYLHQQLLGGFFPLYDYYGDDIQVEKPRPYFNPEMTYYVCSYGGCGSYMLCDYLRNFGNVEHIHSRKPPLKLEYIGAKNTSNPVYGEWFNGVEIPESELDHYKVIYLYKDPVKAIYSRFKNPDHLRHVQCDPTITLEQVIESKKDLYGLEEFFDHYTSNTEKRNYPIYCVKYEDFWDHLSVFNQELGLPDVPALYPVKKETPRQEPHHEVLYQIYDRLLKKMNQMSTLSTFKKG